MTSRTELRQQIRQQRRALSATQRQHHAKAMANQLVHSHIFRSARNIACYLANDGEMDLQPVIRRLEAMNKQCYLPLLSEGKEKRMWFAPYNLGDPLKHNRYGIPEPDCSAHAWLAPQQLDLVLMPLVAFDPEGNRLGMGGGYYDRSFAFLNRLHGIKKPRLVGVAYQLQRCQALPYEPWDVPMSGIVTECGVQHFNGKDRA